MHIQTGIGIGCYHLIPTSNYIHFQTAALALKAISISTEHWHSSTNAIPPPQYQHPNEALFSFIAKLVSCDFHNLLECSKYALHILTTPNPGFIAVELPSSPKKPSWWESFRCIVSAEADDRIISACALVTCLLHEAILVLDHI